MNNREIEKSKIQALVADMDLAPGWTVVEPGCGTGQVSEALCAAVGVSGRIIGLDSSLNMLSQASVKALPGACYLQADASSLPLAPGRAQAVVLFRVFPHLDDCPAALAEAYRVLATGGLLVIAHPAGRERLNRYHARVGGEVAHDMIPGESVMRSLLSTAGFSLQRIEDREERYLVTARKAG